MSATVTFVIPYAPYHEQVVERATASVRRQSIHCDLITIHDSEARGAGWARNQGLALVETPFTVFLDADDEVSPYFAERTLKAWQPKRYIYTDWLSDGERVDAPACPFATGQAHCITALIPTAHLREVNGFDETLKAGEDTDLYLKLMVAGYCGLHLRDPLFLYAKGGLRSRYLVSGVVAGKPQYTEAYHQLVRQFNTKYGVKPMGCCGENPVWEEPIAGEHLEGDMVVESAWMGNRQVRGVRTGRLYERTGNGKPLWVAPEDAYAMPDLFRIVSTDPPLPVIEASDPLDVFREAFDVRPALPDVEAPQVRPAFGTVIGAYKRGE